MEHTGDGAALRTITDLRQTKQGRIAVFFDGEFDFSVDDETLVQYHLAVGKRYTAGQYEQLRLQTQYKKARDKAFSLLSRRAYPAAQLRQKLEQKLGQQDIRLSDDPAQWLAVLERSDSGYVTRMQVGESQQSGLWLRELLGLRSSDFDWEIQDGNFVFTTRGYGHGVGLSQYGADYLARQGKSYREILAHDYTGAVLQERTDF